MGAIAWLLNSIIKLAWIVLIARVVFSWLNPHPRHPLARDAVRLVYRLTDPPLERIRAAVPALVTGGLDLSPIVLFLALGFVDRLV